MQNSKLDRTNFVTASYILAVILIMIVFVIGVIYRDRLNGQFILAGLIALVLGLVIVFEPQLGGHILIITIITNVSTKATIQGFPSINKPLVVLVGLSVLASYLFTQKKQLPKLGQFELFFLTFIGVLALSIFVADYRDLVESKVIALLKDFAILFSIIYAVQNPKYWKQAIRIVIILTTILAALGAYQVFTGNYFQTFGEFAIISEQKILDGILEPRLGGPIGKPNFWAQFLVAVLPLIVYRVLDEKQVLIKMVFTGAAIILVYTVLGTYSRGAFLTMVIILILILIDRRARPSLFLIISIGALIILIFLPSNYSERIRSLTLVSLDPSLGKIYEDSSLRGRYAEVRAGLQMFAENPILGVGAGNYKPNYQLYVSKLNIETRNEPRDAHSLYIETLAETGVIGMIVFIFLFGSLLIGLSKIIKKLGDQDIFKNWSSWISSIRMSIISYLISSIFLHGDYIRYLWILVALGVAGMYLSRKFLDDPTLLFQEKRVIP